MPDYALIQPLCEALDIPLCDVVAFGDSFNDASMLEAAGTGMDKVVKTTCFLADMGDFAAFNEVYAGYFTGKPARSCVAVKALPKGVLCEIEAIAEV